MRYLIIITAFFLLPTVFFAQQTYVPDDQFEQALIDLGYDTAPLNDSVPTKNIENVTELDLYLKNISDLTGIEDFTALEELVCQYNKLSSLDLSNNTALRNLYCYWNKLTSLDVSNSPNLEWFYCDRNDLTSLDLSNNHALVLLYCGDNNLTSLDLSNNSALEILHCLSNKLTSLNIKNGNNKNMIGDILREYFNASGNPNLMCIQVDDSSWSAIQYKWKKDDHAHYSEDCGYTGIDYQVEDETDNISISSSPNPFSQSTMINYQLSKSGNVVLKVYDVFGNEVATLLNEFKDAGTHQAQFNAENLPQEIYFYKIQIDNAIEIGKLLLIK